MKNICDRFLWKYKLFIKQHFISQYGLYFSIYDGTAQIVGFGRIDPYVDRVTSQFIDITFAIHNVSVTCTSHDFGWIFDVPFFDEYRNNPIHHSCPSFLCVFQIELVDALQPILFNIIVNLILPRRGGCMWAW